MTSIAAQASMQDRRRTRHTQRHDLQEILQSDSSSVLTLLASRQRRLGQDIINTVCGMNCDHMTTALLQSLEGLDPKTKLSGASQVTLSEAEVRTLKRDMQEQENLIQGYQVIPATIPCT